MVDLIEQSFDVEMLRNMFESLRVMHSWSLALHSICYLCISMVMECNEAILMFLGNTGKADMNVILSYGVTLDY